MNDAKPAAAETDAATRRTPASWMRVAAKAVPAKWVTVAGLTLFLGATAAFGGLADAPAAAEKPLARLEPGDVHGTGQLEVSFTRAVLIDELPGSGTTPLFEGGERVLVVTGTLHNATVAPLPSLSFARGQLAVAGLPEKRPDGGAVEVSTARLDDATLHPVIQPGLSVEVAFTWPVPADLLHADDELHLTIADLTWFDPSWLSDQPGYWTTPAVPAAELDLVIEDVGAGVEEEQAG